MLEVMIEKMKIFKTTYHDEGCLKILLSKDVNGKMKYFIMKISNI